MSFWPSKHDFVQGPVKPHKRDRFRLCYGYNPFRLGLRYTPGMILSNFGPVPGRTPDMAGGWTVPSGSIGEVPEEL